MQSFVKKFFPLPSGIILSAFSETIVKRKNLLFSFFSSCSKTLEDRIIGSWQLEESWRQVLFGREHFTTGYESGIFTFMDNGDASYVSGTDTMTGFWRSGRHDIW